MARYDYECKNCNRTEEVTRKITDNDPVLCIICLLPMKKLFSPPATHFKGGGWGKVYRDYQPKDQ